MGSLDEVAETISESSVSSHKKPADLAAKLSKNVAISLARVSVNALVALVLPAYLTHHLPTTTYGAWVLILQAGTYVSFLDLGVQTGVAKFVAEYDAKDDKAAASSHASAGFAMMAIAGLLGLCLTLFLAWQVPRLFRNMPPSLYHDVRISVLLVGSSFSFALVCSVFSAIFLGLQRYFIPMTISIVNKALFAAVIVVAVAFHGSLVTMGMVVAVVNFITALFQVVAWHKMVPHIRISFSLVDYRVFRRMLHYCSLFSIWTLGMLCVSGLDVMIVGHYDYNQTAFYSIATLPANFIIVVLGSIFGPMMPASSALSTQRSAIEMGNLLSRATRYGTILLLLTGLPLMVLGLPILNRWVGPTYALSSLGYLRILILANILRNICQPYATMLAATGKQGAATIAAISEAVVNLGSSLYLASRYGAVGVAFGTLLGSFVSLSLHFTVSMHFTNQTLAILRRRLLIAGVFRPGLIALPAVLLLPFWWKPASVSPSTAIVVLWGVSSLLIAWFWGLQREERSRLIGFLKRQLIPTNIASH